MKETLASIKFIASFMKRYSFRLILVLIFIIMTTYLNVNAPKIMGEAIDKLVSPMTVEVTCRQTVCEQEVQGYVVESILYDTLDETINSIEAGTGLPDEVRDDLEKSDNEDLKALTDIDNDTLKTQYEFLIELKTVIDIDDNALKNGFNSQQVSAIEDSSVFTEEQKTALTLTDDDVIAMLVGQGMSKPVATQAMEDPKANLPTDIYNSYQAAMDLQSPEKLSDLYDLADSLTLDKSRSEVAFASFVDTIKLLILAYIFTALSYFLYSILMVRAASNTVGDMRIGLFHKIADLSIRFFDTTSDGDLLSRFVNDMDNISNALTQSFTQAVSQIALLIGVIWMMFSEDTTTITLSSGLEIHNVLAWTMVGFAMISIIIALILVNKAQKYVKVQQDKLGDLNGYVDEQLNGQKTVIAYGLENTASDGFNVVNEDLRQTSFKGQMYSGLLMPAISGIGYINLAFIVFVGSLFIANGSDAVSVGLIVAFIQYSQRFFQPLASVFSQYNLLQLGLTGGSRIKRIFDVESEITDKDAKVEIEGITGTVHINDVTFGYDPQKPVLKNIDIHVEKGQMVALVGPTGSGKTTVMNLMNRFYDVNEGAILVDGRDVREITLSSLRKNVGIVLQESIIFSGTIHDNIAYGSQNATREDVISAAKLANIHDFIMSLEAGYETYVDNSSSVFSTGQKQMMSIARTLITDPDLLILDEATSNVDTVTEEKIQTAMNNALHNRTSFVIAHRLKTILDADIIVVLKDGEIIEQGSHQQLLDQAGFYSELYHNQFVID